MTEQELRQKAATDAFRIARDIESLLKFLNENEGSFVVADGNEMIMEHEFHEHIAQYMRLGLSCENPKPE